MNHSSRAVPRDGSAVRCSGTVSVRVFTVVLLTAALSSMRLYAAPQSADESDGPNAGTVTDRVPTIAELQKMETFISRQEEVPEDVRTQIAEQLRKGISNLQAAEAAATEAETLRAEVDTAAEQQASLQKQLTEEQNRVAPSPPTDISFDEATSRAADSAADAAAAAGALAQIEDEISARNELRPQLPELLAENARSAEEVTTLLAAPAEAGEHPELSISRRLRLLTRRERLMAEKQLLEAKTRAYETTQVLWTLKRDLAYRKAQAADSLRVAWTDAEAAARRRRAETEAEEARRAAARSLPEVRQIAEANAALAESHAGIVRDSEDASSRLNSVRQQLQTLTDSFRNLVDRSTAARFSQAIGLLLRNRQSTLPDVGYLEADSAKRENDIAELNFRQLEWRAERMDLLDLNTAVAREVSRIEIATGSPISSQVESEVRRLLNERSSLLTQLETSSGRHIDLLVRLDTEERKFQETVTEESRWIAEHVLWVRSNGILGSQPTRFTEAVSSLVRQADEVRRSLKPSGVLSSRWWRLLIGGLFLLLLLVVRSRLKSRLKVLGEIAAKPNCTRFAPTAEALILTVLLACPLPAVVWAAGAFIPMLGPRLEFVSAFGDALQTVSAAWFVLEFLRQSALTTGLLLLHLDWPREAVAGVRRTTRFLLMTQLPSLLISVFAETLGDELLAGTFGRIAFITAMVCGCIACYRLLNPNGSVIASLFAESSSPGLFWETRWLWCGLAVAFPGLLAVASFAGYHYTAVNLSSRVATSIGIVLSAVLTASLLTRLLLVSYRQLAIRRGRERRIRMQQAAASDPDQPQAAVEAAEIRPGDINQQIRQLIRVGAAAAALYALYLLWIDILPALGILNRFRLWQNSLAVVSEDEPTVWVTAADLCLSLLIVGLTIFASRNIPGLLEISILQKLPMDAGARYAASMICRYLIVVGGLVAGFYVIGIGWGNVQWLVAAVTVGLGFGLQEIFANFVSGIILLFERPIRIGDTVTIGDITGTVTRIQIRATTVLDWDNKELIVPNRDFVTGNLVNWTLSNPTLRLICSVGVAYGSDTRLTTRLLYQVAEENEEVLDAPEPVVVFDQFGDSALIFELRLFVTGMVNFRRLRHRLNMAIDDAFREHNIEIAFPQRDLHIRTLPDQSVLMPLIGRSTSPGKGDAADSAAA